MTLVGDAIMARWARDVNANYGSINTRLHHSGMAINHGALERNAVSGGRAPGRRHPASYYERFVYTE